MAKPRPESSVRPAHRRPRRHRLPGWALGVLALGALAGVYLGVSGYAMAASFSVSNPEALGHWRPVARIYAILALLSVVLLAGSVLLAAWRFFSEPASVRSGAV